MIHEFRTYVAHDGKRDALLERFRTTTLSLFAEHGIVVLGFWLSHTDRNMLAYLCVFEDDTARERAWKAFGSDPRWLASKAATEIDGPLTASLTPMVLDPVGEVAAI